MLKVNWIELRSENGYQRFEVDRISRQLTNRIKELAERYEKTLPCLDENVKTLESKVSEHLKKMGFEWN